MYEKKTLKSSNTDENNINHDLATSLLNVRHEFSFTGIDCFNFLKYGTHNGQFMHFKNKFFLKFPNSYHKWSPIAISRIPL